MIQKTIPTLLYHLRRLLSKVWCYFCTQKSYLHKDGIMKGGTRKRGSTWSYYFDMGTVGGKRQKKEKGGFKTKKEAETALAKAINEYNNTGTVFEPSEITVKNTPTL